MRVCMKIADHFGAIPVNIKRGWWVMWIKESKTMLRVVMFAGLALTIKTIDLGINADRVHLLTREPSPTPTTSENVRLNWEIGYDSEGWPTVEKVTTNP